MKVHPFITLVLPGILVVCSASAQQRNANTTPPGTNQASTTVPESRIAVIYSDAFQDPKTGIARFNSLVGTLNREFQPKQTELNQLKQRITQLSKEVTDAQGLATQESLRQKSEQLDTLKKDYQRKGEDAEAAYNKRRDDIFRPLQLEITKALETYAKAHGIGVIIDASQVPVVYAADNLDITRAFIAEFNSKNPATASVTTPK